MKQKRNDHFINALIFVFITICILVSSSFDTPKIWNEILMELEAK
jgi:hypothetical protein